MTETKINTSYELAWEISLNPFNIPSKPTSCLKKPIKVELLEFLYHHILEKDVIPPIYNPELVSAQEGQQFMSPNEQVLGIVGPKGTAVAYSTWHLDSHEIVNDIIDGIALAVTW